MSKDVSCFLYLLSWNSRIVDDLIPRCFLCPFDHGVETLRFGINEFSIDSIAFELMFDEAFHEGGVATDPNLKMKVCKGRRFQLGFHVILRMFEARETCLSKRVDVNDGRSAEFGISQCREHRG